MPAPKGTVAAGAAMTNSYRLEFLLMPPIFFTSIGDMKEELKTAELADHTAQTTGAVPPVETDVKQYVHHVAERIAMEAWFLACKSGAPLHKQIGSLFLLGADGSVVASYMLDGVICKGRSIPALEAKGDGEGVELTWSLQIDNIIPL